MSFPHSFYYGYDAALEMNLFIFHVPKGTACGASIVLSNEYGVVLYDLDAIEDVSDLPRYEPSACAKDKNS